MKKKLKKPDIVTTRERVLKYLTKEKPLGGINAWEEQHKERALADERQIHQKNPKR